MKRINVNSHLIMLAKFLVILSIPYLNASSKEDVCLFVPQSIQNNKKERFTDLFGKVKALFCQQRKKNIAMGHVQEKSCKKLYSGYDENGKFYLTDEEGESKYYPGDFMSVNSSK